MQDEQIPLLRGIFTLVALFFAQSVLSLLVFKHKKFRAWLNGTPTILIANGNINHTAMQKLMISFSDMLEAMHGKDISDLSKIDYAIMETNGTINIFQKPEKKGEDFSCPLIINGGVIAELYAVFWNNRARDSEESQSGKTYTGGCAVCLSGQQRKISKHLQEEINMKSVIISTILLALCVTGAIIATKVINQTSEEFSALCQQLLEYQEAEDMTAAQTVYRVFLTGGKAFASCCLYV